MSDKYAALKQAKPYELRFSRLWERYDEACHGNAEHMRDILELALDALETAERHIVNADRDVLALLAERDADRARIADQYGIILSARKFISEYAGFGDVGATEFLRIIDRAAGISLKIEGE